jgi:hypothetical protein
MLNARAILIRLQQGAGGEHGVLAQAHSDILEQKLPVQSQSAGEPAFNENHEDATWATGSN